jgi:hypothetical protein
MDTHRKSKKKKSTFEMPPMVGENGVFNTEDYNFRFVEPLREGEGRMKVSLKPSAMITQTGEKAPSEGQRIKSTNKPTRIKAVRLEGKVLFINDGQEVVSFNSRKGQDDTKIFKIVDALWDGRYEMRGNEIINRGSVTMSAANLMRVSGVKTKGALDKQVNRLNDRFLKAMLAIRVDSRGGRYKLVIIKSG